VSVSLVESPQGVVVRMLPTGEPQERDLVSAGRFQLPTRPYTCHETVEPDAEQRTGMVGWSAHSVTL